MSNVQNDGSAPGGTGHSGSSDTPQQYGQYGQNGPYEPPAPYETSPPYAPYPSQGPAYGATPPPPQYPPPPTSDPRRGLPTWVVVLIVVLVLALIVAVGVALTSSLGADRDESTGEVVAGGDLSAFDLRVGDCLIDAYFREAEGQGEEGETFDSVPAVPCEEPHGVEVYAIVSLDEGEWPGESAVGEQADDVCYDRFESFVGRSYETSVLDFGSYLPTEDSWAAGDRGVTCLVFDPSGQVRGTLEGAAR